MQKNNILENLLNENSFKRYEEGFINGFLNSEFVTDFENLKSINDKIVFLEYTEKQLNKLKNKLNLHYKELRKLEIDIFKATADIHKERKIIDYKKEIKNIKSSGMLNKRKNKISNLKYIEGVNPEKKLKLLNESIIKIKDEINFWRRQLKTKDENILYKKEISNDFDSSQKSIAKTNIKESLQWLGTKEQLIILLKLLQEYDLIVNRLEIDIECKGYLANFTDSNYNPFTDEQPVKIISKLMNLTELSYIIGELVRKHRLIDEKKYWVKTAIIFRNKNINKFYSINSLSTSYQKHREDTSKIDSILKKVTK